MIHLGDILMQLDEAGSGLSAGDSDEAFFHDGAVVRLNKTQLAWSTQFKIECDMSHLPLSTCRLRSTV
jgi:hypothetical protein